MGIGHKSHDSRAFFAGLSGKTQIYPVTAHKDMLKYMTETKQELKRKCMHCSYHFDSLAFSLILCYNMMMLSLLAMLIYALRI